jgi:hypothetical protein
MGTSDAALPWALKILMIALVTVAVFIYRKPFTHLFSAVGYGTLGSTERAEVSLRDAGFTFRRNSLEAASVAIPGVAGYRAARWARRNPGQAAALAGGVAAGAGAGAAAAAATSGEAAAGTGTVGAGDAYAARFRPDAPPAADGEGETSAGSRRGVGATGLTRNRNMPETESGARTAPPLDLPSRSGNGTPAAGAATGWSRGAGRSAAPGPGPGPAPVRSRATSSAPPASRTNGTSGPSGPSGPSRSNGTSGTSRSSGSAAPAWPHQPASTGWTGASTGAGPRQRPATERRPAAPPPGQGAAPGGGNGTDKQRAMPFWLRPIRRDK